MSTRSGPGVVLVSVYAVLALAATGRSVLQILEYFSRAPVAYLLSALAAVIYIVATFALARGSRTSWRVARAAILIEMVGVLVVGLLSYLVPSAFPRQDRVVALRLGLRVRAACSPGARPLVAAPDAGECAGDVPHARLTRRLTPARLALLPADAVSPGPPAQSRGAASSASSAGSRTNTG